MIYFDNAATGGFKPNAVIETATTAVRYLSANPGRSGHRLAVAGAKAVYECRALMAKVFNASPERVIFTKNCTEALNLAIFGTVKKGARVITTAYEHNSVLRPLKVLESKGVISLDVVYPQRDISLEKAIEQKITPQTYLVVCTAISNVTGYELPLYEIGKVCRKHGLKLLIDGAQGGGHIRLDMKELSCNMLALAGHKGLLGIMGSGALIIDDGTQVEPLMHGGTGSESTNLLQPRTYPERLEAGTINLPAVMALLEGVRHISHSVDSIGEHLIKGSSRLIDGLKEVPELKVYSTPNRAGIVAFKLNSMPSAEVADCLNREYDIAVRGGLHCAPLMHEYLNTTDCGLVRASLAVQNGNREIDYFIKAIKAIASY